MEENRRHERQREESQRADTVGQAVRDARSRAWDVRAEAGRVLAGVAEREDVGPVVRELLLDAQDTAVTRTTARALLERGDLVGVGAVLRALALAGEWWTADQLVGAVREFADEMEATGRGDAYAGLMAALARDEDPGVRDEALGFVQP